MKKAKKGKDHAEGKPKNGFVILWSVLAVCCFLYGGLVFLTGSGTAFFAVWLILGVLLLALAILAKHSVWKKLPGVLKGVTVALFCLGISVFLVTEGCILSHFFDKGEKDLDYLIVLGAQMNEDGPSPLLERRLRAAARYLSENPDTICIVSGGQGTNEPVSEAEGMAAYLTQKGISPDRILKETESKSTMENLTFSKRLIEDPDASVGIVTNNFHVFRAVLTAKRAGFSHVCGIASEASALFFVNNLLREFFGVIKFVLTQ